MKVLYSWQMDAPRKINKDFIHDALKEAIDSLNEDVEFSEAERIDLDQDTKGVLGAPPIAKVIFDKIRQADVFVADVSLIGEGPDGKRHINSNVGIELGYALGANGYVPLLNIMNTFYGSAEKLPFDLRDRRRPVCYDLAPPANREEREKAKTRLVGELKVILRDYISTLSGNAVEHVPESSSYIASAFWNKSETIIRNYLDNGELLCDSTHLISIRVIPQSNQSELTRADCRNKISNFAPLLRQNGYTTGTNKWGALSYNVIDDTNSMFSGAQLFKSGELWMFAVGLIGKKADKSYWETNHETLMRYLPEALERAISFGDELIEGEASLHLTASDMSDVYIESLNGLDAEKCIFQETVELTKNISPDIDAKLTAFEFTQKIYAEAGATIPNRFVENYYL